MRIKLVINNRNNTYFAEAIYTEDTIIVKAGGKIASTFAEHIRGGKKALRYRNDKEYVGDNGIILQDCIFTSPSTAAQFVSGISKNGYIAWKLSDGRTLAKYLKEKGLR